MLTSQWKPWRQKKTLKGKNRMKTNPRTVMLKRQEGTEQSEVGGKLGNSCFTQFKGEKGLKRKNKQNNRGMSFACLSSQEVRR